MQVDVQSVAVIVPAASTIVAAVISYFAMVGTASPQRKLLADMDVYDRLAKFHRNKWLDAKEQEAFMYLRAMIGVQIRKLYLYDHDRMQRWMRVSGVFAVLLTAVFSIIVRNAVINTSVAVLFGSFAPFVGMKLFELKTRRRDESLKSLAEGPWSDAECHAGDTGEDHVSDYVGADEHADICKETLHE